MIVVDTSALMAILLEEPEAEACADALARPGVVLISAGTLTEANVVAARRGFLEDPVDLIAELNMEVVLVSEETAPPRASHMLITAGACTRLRSTSATPSPMCWQSSAIARSSLSATISP